MPRARREIPWIEWRNGTAYVYWYDEDRRRTKRLSLRTADRVEAQKRYAAFLSSGHAVFADAGGLAGLSVSQALDDYWREHVQPNVVDKARAEDAITHLKAWFGAEPIVGIDIPASRAYADARRLGTVGGGKRRKNGEGSDSTIRRELVVLSAAANHAAKWKRIGPSATPPTGMPSIELPAETRKEALGDNDWLTRDELARAVATATGKLKDFIVIAYDSASRRGAVERLTKFQVDLAAGRVNLRSPAETANQRRSKKRRPVVPIGAEARPIYERLMSESTTEFLFGVPTDMYRPFRRHMESIGLGHKRHPHILRHSRASHLLQEGVSLFNVAKLLGDTAATVERVYGHFAPEYLGETKQAKSGA